MNPNPRSPSFKSWFNSSQLGDVYLRRLEPWPVDMGLNRNLLSGLNIGQFRTQEPECVIYR